MSSNDGGGAVGTYDYDCAICETGGTLSAHSKSGAAKALVDNGWHWSAIEECVPIIVHWYCPECKALILNFGKGGRDV